MNFDQIEKAINRVSNIHGYDFRKRWREICVYLMSQKL